jgi:hypothetical protein
MSSSKQARLLPGVIGVANLKNGGVGQCTAGGFMLGIVTALDSAFAAQLYVRFTTLPHSGRCTAPPISPSPTVSIQ